VRRQREALLFFRRPASGLPQSTPERRSRRGGVRAAKTGRETGGGGGQTCEPLSNLKRTRDRAQYGSKLADAETKVAQLEAAR
jgi:hypothetical protein